MYSDIYTSLHTQDLWLDVWYTHMLLNVKDLYILYFLSGLKYRSKNVTKERILLSFVFLFALKYCQKNLFIHMYTYKTLYKCHFTKFYHCIVMYISLSSWAMRVTWHNFRAEKSLSYSNMCNCLIKMTDSLPVKYPIIS